MYATDAIALGRFYDLNPVASDGEAFAVGYTWMMDTAGASNYRKHYLVRLFKNWQGGTKRDPLYAKSFSVNQASGIGQVTLSTARHNYTGTAYGQYLIMAINNMDGLTSFATGAIPAGEQTFTTFGTDNTNVWFYPDNAADIFSWPSQVLPQNRTATPALTAVKWADDVVGHQGRVVTNIQYFEPFGAGTELWYTDKVSYNAIPNSLGTGIGGGGPAPSTAQYGEENVSGIAFMASMTADVLLVMKHDGGGYLVRGDLSNPVVSRLPMIESPHVSRSIRSAPRLVWSTRPVTASSPGPVGMSARSCPHRSKASSSGMSCPPRSTTGSAVEWRGSTRLSQCRTTTCSTRAMVHGGGWNPQARTCRTTSTSRSRRAARCTRSRTRSRPRCPR
jgi:hypothetical protein